MTVASPLAVRARRVRALFLCGLQEGVFPAPARPEPFLGDAERRAINAASGLRLRLHEDPLAAERYLFYAAVSRPTDRLALSWHAADADGDPVVPSLFVADVRDVLGEDLWAGRERRALGAAGWPAAAAPTERERLRAEALAAPGPGAPIAPLNDPAVLRALRERRTWSASALETWAGCPVKWFVERFLSPDPLEPDPEPLVRGALAHRVLEEAFRALRAGGDGRVTRDCLPEVKRLVHEALRRHAGSHPPSVNPERLRASLRRLEADLLGYVERAAALGSAFAPEHFELCFGGTDDEHPPVVLAGGELALAGRVDRVDVEPGGERAIVYDYKGKSAPKQAGWVAGRRLQMGLYMLAVGRLLGVEVVGGLYQPLGGGDPRPRGLLRDDADPGLDAVGTDRLEDEAFDAVLAEVEQVAVRALAEARAGALEPQPESCAYRGGCAYPSICRCEP